MNTDSKSKLTGIDVHERSDLLVAVFQQAINQALARHRALGQRVAVADAQGNVRVVSVEELEREAAEQGNPIVYSLPQSS